jgi:hypothetical protein
MEFLFIGLFLMFMYFIPTMVSGGKPQLGGVFVLNLFLGWTFVFWVISLAWAVMPGDSHE